MSSLLDSKRLSASKLDIEKDAHSVSEDAPDEFYYSHPFMKKLLSWGVEARGMTLHCMIRSSLSPKFATGILPVPPHERTETQYNKIFYIWLSANFNILSYVPYLLWMAGLINALTRFSAGTLGPVVFGLGLRDSCLVILFFNLLASALPAYLCVIMRFRANDTMLKRSS